MLPPGTLRVLKGHHEAIVAVVSLATALVAMELGVPPEASITALIVTLGAFHLRASSRERHQIQMAEKKVEQAALNVEIIKARHRDLLTPDQPSLLLEPQERGTAPRRTRTRKPNQ